MPRLYCARAHQTQHLVVQASVDLTLHRRQDRRRRRSAATTTATTATTASREEASGTFVGAGGTARQGVGHCSSLLVVAQDGDGRAFCAAAALLVVSISTSMHDAGVACHLREEEGRVGQVSSLIFAPVTSGPYHHRQYQTEFGTDITAADAATAAHATAADAAHAAQVGGPGHGGSAGEDGEVALAESCAYECL